MPLPYLRCSNITPEVRLAYLSPICKGAACQVRLQVHGHAAPLVRLAYLWHWASQWWQLEKPIKMNM